MINIISNIVNKEIYNGETLSWFEFNRVFDEEKTYIVFATATNYDGDLLPVKTFTSSIGIKFIIREIVDGKVQNAVNRLKFKTFKFGEKKWSKK